MIWAGLMLAELPSHGVGNAAEMYLKCVDDAAWQSTRSVDDPEAIPVALGNCQQEFAVLTEDVRTNVVEMATQRARQRLIEASVSPQFRDVVGEFHGCLTDIVRANEKRQATSAYLRFEALFDTVKTNCASSRSRARELTSEVVRRLHPALPTSSETGKNELIDDLTIRWMNNVATEQLEEPNAQN